MVLLSDACVLVDNTFDTLGDTYMAEDGTTLGVSGIDHFMIGQPCYLVDEENSVIFIQSDPNGDRIKKILANTDIIINEMK